MYQVTLASSTGTIMATTKSNGLVCFTNCLLPQEDGSLVEKDLWIDEWRGVILDAQVGHQRVCLGRIYWYIVPRKRSSYARSVQTKSLI